jgi:hypothetical protein
MHVFQGDADCVSLSHPIGRLSGPAACRTDRGRYRDSACETKRVRLVGLRMNTSTARSGSTWLVLTKPRTDHGLHEIQAGSLGQLGGFA